jgi:ribosomal protein S18 acetylase RimI-like enzyme
LLTNIEQKIGHHGGTQIELGVMAENDRAVSFYQAVGYEFKEEIYDENIETHSHIYTKSI